MALNTLDGRTRDLMSASYAVPDLETALKQAIYNSIDAHAKAIRLFVNVANASFTVIDDGDGIQPDDLHECIGECYASSRVPVSKCSRIEKKSNKKYGSRGAFLYELITLAADVEIESRVHEHWTSCRKVFKEGKVVFNARSKELRETPGTKVFVSNLFKKLPVRRKDLSRNRKYRSRVIQNIHNFCVSMSMIWPSLSLDIRYEGENVRPVTIPAVKSCLERFYVDFSSKSFSFLVRGYLALIPASFGGLGQGIKQAKSYYQFMFLENEWVEECHRLCAHVITEAALQSASAIPIFVLKIAVPSDHYDISRVGKKNELFFKNPEQLHQFLFEFVEGLAVAEFNQSQACKSDPSTSICIGDPRAGQLVPVPAWNGNTEPRYFTSDSQSWIHEESTLSSQRDSYIQVDNVDCGFVTEDDEKLPRGSDCESLLSWSSIFEEHGVLVEQSHSECYLAESPSRCHVCGHVNDASESSIVEVDRNSNVDFVTDFGAMNTSISESSGSDSNDLTVDNLTQEDIAVDKTEHCLEDIFFSTKPSPLLVKQKVLTDVEDFGDVMPWLSSKPDAYDCIDSMLELFQDGHHKKSKHHGKDSGNQENSIQIDDNPQSDALSPNDTAVLAGPTRKSEYFAVSTVERQANSLLKRWIGSKKSSVEDLAGALRIDNFHVLKGEREIKVSKSTLAKLQVVRQVDRKFILVQADTSRGKLVLCIDQHAADERIRLEQLEEEMFGRDGSLRRVEIQKHGPPLVLRVNFKEREVLKQYEGLIKSWGFDFESVTSEPELFISMHRKSELDDKTRVLLYATPKVEKRAANADDFREFIQLLASAGETYSHSQIRPPVITRLLHSRACRSAIMFGDHLSLGQCRDLIEDLKTCQLPFQCAHGRPSVVPLVEIHGDGTSN
ncbi:hypothetical protein PPTG_04191 [Phytophthora nicotianae INRA-310]|uniref:MutL C-terminal dimerisation domain-containing protein n=1 Tax=Phytophthora nicotianae (strain INRA-310) TaxID=761204 RepID=W2R2C9_PHYN3|nr:hypothetical protein PPTG_04191 [Phytophthora nicotianae INRA-310]ETN18660.1 hypothetical protein PPTG_04191 [Phytophthora nicotianae INRA-310]